ncbi:hypothetical protein JW935_07350 [candidate division KSB1 bacterium]|nr:hypothetical protein [candidate division KSB1 bacterium]
MFREVKNGGDERIRKHVYATYFTLRWGVAALALIFPWVLVFGGSVFADVPWQNSLSAYYHAPLGASSGVMRDWFVGFLFALGALMYLYKGFTQLENWLLNIASILTVGVAMFPMAWPPANGDGLFSLHGSCALGAFVCLALVSWLSPGYSLELMQPGPKRTRYVTAYITFGIFLLVFPGIAWLLTNFMGDPGKFIFSAEVLGLVGFTGFWVTKSLEMGDTKGELKALWGDVAKAAR